MNADGGWVAPVGDGLVTLNEPIAVVRGKGCVSAPTGIPGEVFSENDSCCSVYVDVRDQHRPPIRPDRACRALMLGGLRPQACYNGLAAARLLAASRMYCSDGSVAGVSRKPRRSAAAPRLPCRTPPASRPAPGSAWWAGSAPSRAPRRRPSAAASTAPASPSLARPAPGGQADLAVRVAQGLLARPSADCRSASAARLWMIAQPAACPWRLGKRRAELLGRPVADRHQGHRRRLDQLLVRQQLAQRRARPPCAPAHCNSWHR